MRASTTKGPSLLLQAIGATLPAAMAVALSPFPVIAIVLIVAGAHGTRNGVLFALGWISGLAVVATLVMVVFGAADDPDSTSSAIVDWFRVLAGAALIVLGARKWLRRPRVGEDVEMPPWMATLADATAGRSLLLGAVLSGVNPKNFVLTAAAATSMIEAGAHGGNLFIAAAVFVLLGSWTVIAAVAAHLVGGRRPASALDAVRVFMIANSTTIMVLVFVILGANVLGGGLAGLGR